MEGLRVIYTRYFGADFRAPDADLSGRVCLVTGANTGVGYQAVLHLANRKASTILFGVRSTSKGLAAAERVYRDCPAYKGEIKVWELDMARFESVISFAKRCEKELDRLDISILNAGVLSTQYAKTVDGWEESLQVNVLSTGLLGMLLLPKLSATGRLGGSTWLTPLKPHLTIVSSDVQYLAVFKCRKTEGSILEAVSDEKNFSFDQYNITKLLEMFLVRELAVHPSASGVVVNACNPGLTTSELRRSAPGLFQWVFGGIAWPAEKGSRNHIYASLTETNPGAFIHCCKERAPATMVTNEAGTQLQKKFWSEAQKLYQSLLRD